MSRSLQVGARRYKKIWANGFVHYVYIYDASSHMLTMSSAEINVGGHEVINKMAVHRVAYVSMAHIDDDGLMALLTHDSYSNNTSCKPIW